MQFVELSAVTSVGIEHVSGEATGSGLQINLSNCGLTYQASQAVHGNKRIHAYVVLFGGYPGYYGKTYMILVYYLNPTRRVLILSFGHSRQDHVRPRASYGRRASAQNLDCFNNCLNKPTI